jgi:hypothetical protein
MRKLTRLWRLLLAGQLLLALGLFSTSCGDDNYVVNSSTVCRCDASIEGPCFIASEHWKHAVNDLLEVSAIDFRKGHFVGAQCQAEVGAAWEPWPFHFNAWRPFDGFKRNMSGQLRVFNRADDEDWNLHVRPNSAFTYLLDEVEALHEDSADDHKRYCDPPCIETEISPDKLFWNNPWFYQPGAHPQDTDGNGFSWLEGREMVSMDSGSWTRTTISGRRFIRST